MNIMIGTVVLMALAGWVWQRLGSDDRRQYAYAAVRRMAMTNLPRMVVALISAGLFAELLPDDIVCLYLGDTAGYRGVLIGAALGVITPGGAFVAFALAAAATSAGAAMPTMVSYLCAWALFSLTKVIAEETVFLGGRFIVLRVAVSFPVPLIAGVLALWVERVFA